MNRIIFTCAFLPMHLLSYAQPIYVVDSSAIDAFFKVADILSQDQDPTQAQWDTFHRTGGYRLIRELDLNRRMSIAFKPSEAPRRDSLLAIRTFNFDTYTVKHLSKVYRQKEEIRRYLGKTNFHKLLANARQRVGQFFPEQVDTATFMTGLYFALFQPDAYPQDTTIVADAYAAMKMGSEAFMQTLAHELYHTYCRLYAPYLANSQLSEKGGRHYQVLRTLNSLHNEGVADLIDKSPPSSDTKSIFSLFLPQSFTDTYDSSFQATPTTLRKMDSLLVLTAEDTGYVSTEIYELLDFGDTLRVFTCPRLFERSLGLPLSSVALITRWAQAE